MDCSVGFQQRFAREPRDQSGRSMRCGLEYRCAFIQNAAHRQRRHRAQSVLMRRLLWLAERLPRNFQLELTSPRPQGASPRLRQRVSKNLQLAIGPQQWQVLRLSQSAGGDRFPASETHGLLTQRRRQPARTRGRRPASPGRNLRIVYARSCPVSIRA